MNSEDFKTIVDGCKVNIESTLNKKSQEYSSKEDKLHNFVEAAKLMRCKTKEYALFGMLNKHLVSVIDMIVKYEQKGILPDESMVEEKIGDSINYFVLLKACFLEDIYNKNDKESSYGFGYIKQKPIDLNKLIEENKKRNCAFEFTAEQQAAMANSLYTNPRKRLVVEIMRTKLKPIFVYLTENNMFKEYEIIKGICNREEMKRDEIGDDEFWEDIVVAVEQLDFSKDMVSVRDKIINEIAEGLSKFNVGDKVMCIVRSAWNNEWKALCWLTIDRINVGIENRKIFYFEGDGVGVNEENCFKTEEEAEKECKRRNKEIEKGSAKE